MVFTPLSSSGEVGTSFSAIYSVDDLADDGSIGINLPNEESLDGIVHPNGDIFTFVNTNTNAPLMGVAIRKTQ